MNFIQMRIGMGALICSISAAMLFTGCASTDSKAGAEPKAEKTVMVEGPPLPEGVTLKKAEHLTGVWHAPGFDFKGQPALRIEPTVYSAIERPNEVEMRKFAVREVRDRIAERARESGVFSSVSTDESASSGTNTLRLVNTIIEYEKGGGGARYWAGVYGAGQPVVRVRGLMYDSNTNLVFVYDVKRSGESGYSKVFGGFRGDEGIQREDIKDLALDLVDYFKESAGIPVKRD